METLQNDERFGFMAVSLGFFDTLMSCSAATTSSELSEEDQRRAGIQPGFVRMSIGITGSLEQRWGQLETGLRRVGII
jgi:methionine-gamma-lyase